MFLWQGCTEAKSRKQELTGKEVAKKIAKKAERASAEERGETVLNNAVSYSESRARERRWNNTEQCRKPKLTRTIERRRKYPTNWLWRLHNFPSMLKNSRATWYCAAVQEKSHDLVRCWARENVPECLEKLQNSKHSGKKWLIRWSIEKISSVQSSQLLLQVSACQEDCKWLLLWRLLWKLTSCLDDLSLFSIGILFKVFLIWSHAVRHFINYIVLISLISKQ